MHNLIKIELHWLTVEKTGQNRWNESVCCVGCCVVCCVGCYVVWGIYWCISTVFLFCYVLFRNVVLCGIRMHSRVNEIDLSYSILYHIIILTIFILFFHLFAFYPFVYSTDNHASRRPGEKQEKKGKKYEWKSKWTWGQQTRNKKYAKINEKENEKKQWIRK